jgi:2-polyprenyl-6-methoxyphenol hydroxylase-like FAD-dependent oxidoreductase
VETQVAIVGGGPVGLGLAIDLGLRGVSVVLMERQEALHHIPKGQNLTQRTMEHFRFWGVEEEIRAARVMPTGYPSAGINAWGDLMSDYAHPWFRRSQVDQYYFTGNERLPQYATEQVLRSRVAELPSVTTLFGTEALAVDQDDSRATVSTGGGSVVEADYVVGCDGSHSTVRAHAGIGEQCSEHDRRMVLLVFRSRELHELLDARFGETSFFNVLHPDLDGYWRFLGRVDVGERWFFHTPVAPDATPESLDLPALLHDAVGAGFDLELDHMGFWDLRVAVADAYRAGRVFIAGDAAHSHPPYGGYGVNTGLEDARNLGWKLAAAIAGWGGDPLLASYTQERRPVFVSTARDFIEAFIENDRAFVTEHDPRRDQEGFAAAWEQRRSRSNIAVTEFEPHYEGSQIVFGPPGGVSSALGTHTYRARAGHHLPPPSPRGRELFAALGSGFSLLTADATQEIVARFTAAAARLDLPLAVVPTEMDRYRSRIVLVRPDHFVSWVDAGTRFEPGDVVARSTGR